MKAGLALLCACGVWLWASCSTEVSAPAPRSGACVESVSGKDLFVGSDKCLAQLTPQIVDGTIVIDHEYVVLYEGDPKIIPPYDRSALWLNIPEALSDEAISYTGERKVLAGKFEVAKGPVPGIYGNGTSKRGALLRRIIVIRH